MTKIIAEIGINHNGDIDMAKKLIDIASVAGCDYVKFQKRTPDLCVPEHKKNEIKKGTPWGDITYLDYKKKLEFGKYEYDEIDHYCRERGIKWFASAWDIDSAKFLKSYCPMVKIPSAKITDIELLKYCRNNFETVIISTGMSTEEEIETAIKTGNPDIIFHTESSYPARYKDLRLEYINWLKRKYPDKSIGYSGHEYGLTTTYAAATLGVDYIERHVTIDHNLWGSDQLASVDPVGLFKIVRGVRDIEKALTGYGPRELSESEMPKLKDLR